jgi:4-amino-4-deoxy-L-arabinose transferase-like glycosyltransferase
MRDKAANAGVVAAMPVCGSIESHANTRFFLTCVWALFIVRGLFYIGFVPLWEGLDEWGHYAVIQIIATRGHLLAGRDERISSEIQASLKLAPWVDGEVRQDSYWLLPDADRTRREDALRSIPPEWAREPAVDGRRAYEAQQPPLYYWLFALAYRATAGLSFLTQIWLLRFLGLLLASAAIPLGFFAAKIIFGTHLQALGIVVLIAATPELMLTVSHIGNDSLAVALGGLLLLTLFQWKEAPRSLSRALALGTVLGLALLTKAYFIALLPPILVFAAIWAKRKGAYRQALSFLAWTAIISAWWYIGTWRETHSLSGEQIEISGVASLTSLAAAMVKMNWLRAIDFAFVSHTWLGNWSMLVVRSWMYRIFVLLAGLAGVGLILRLMNRGKHLLPSRGDLMLPLSCYLTFVLGLGYHALRAFQVDRSGTTLAHYLAALATAEAILMLAGLYAVTPAVMRPAIIPGGTICLAALEFFGTHFYAIPYYTGFTAHQPNGSIPVLKIQQLQGGGLQIMIARLAINKPAFLNGMEIASLWALFLAATSGLIIFCGAIWVVS